MNRKKLNISPVIFTLIVILSVTVAITESKLINFNIDADVDVNDHTRDQYQDQLQGDVGGDQYDQDLYIQDFQQQTKDNNRLGKNNKNSIQTDNRKRNINRKLQAKNKQQYTSYENKYGPQAKTSEEEIYRIGVYDRNAKNIEEHNRNASASYQRGKTNLMYEDPKEFIKGILMELPERPPQARKPIAVPKGFKAQPVDWRVHMTQAGHQKSKCGSCYAFSVTSLIQAYLSIQKKSTKRFSQQQLVDCCKDGCMGCKGGWPASALEYFASSGMASYQKYPYTASQQSCRIRQGGKYNRIINKNDPYNEVRGIEGLGYALQKGPVNVIIDASKWDPLYKSGIFNQCESKTTSYNHAVICSGMKVDNSWVVRNSWGKDWGDQGYIYLPSGNSCGLADRGLIPNLQIQQIVDVQNQQQLYYQEQQQQYYQQSQQFATDTQESYTEQQDFNADLQDLQDIEQQYYYNEEGQNYAEEEEQYYEGEQDGEGEEYYGEDGDNGGEEQYQEYEEEAGGEYNQQEYEGYQEGQGQEYGMGMAPSSQLDQ